MENTNKYDEDDQVLPAVRSGFLTVLCILTFLGSTYGIVTGFAALFTANKIVASAKKNMDIDKEKEQASKRLKEKNDTEARFENKMLNSMDSILNPQKMKQSGVGSAIASILTLVGAILMWKLKRKGYWVYIAGTIIGVAVPFLVYGTNNLIGMISAIIPGFIGVLFIVFYGLNLRDMRQGGK